MQELRMVHLATVANGFGARLLAARLGAEGVVWQLRGESSLYPVGSVEVLVAASGSEAAGRHPGVEGDRERSPAAASSWLRSRSPSWCCWPCAPCCSGAEPRPDPTSVG